MKKITIAMSCLAALVCSCQQSAAPKNDGMKRNDDMQRPKEQPAPCCKPPAPCCKPKDRCCESEKPEAPKESQTVKAEAAPESQTASTPEVKVEAKQ